MSPYLSLCHHSNQRAANAKFGSEDVLAHVPRLIPLPDFPNNLFSQNCHRISFSPRTRNVSQSRINRVSNVLFCRVPFQICHAIIGLYSILMIYLRQLQWIGYECFRNQSMRFSVIKPTSVAQHDQQIRLRVSWSQPSSESYKAFSSTRSLWITPHPSIFSDPIDTFIPFNIFHKLRESAGRFASILHFSRKANKNTL